MDVDDGLYGGVALEGAQRAADGIVGGAVLAETIFAYPGLGSLLVSAVSSRDYPVVEGVGFAMVVSVSAAVLLLVVGNREPVHRRSHHRR